MIRCYAPILDKAGWFPALYARAFEALPDAIQSSVPYDRVSVDRALAIWNDLETVAPGERLRIADLGCNIGVIGQTLAAIGHDVTGIENDLAGRVQPYYPAENGSVARHVASAHGLATYHYKIAAIEDFAAGNELYDVGLLLSVAHQWWAGYAGTSRGVKTLPEIQVLTAKLTHRFRRYLYLEHPESLDGMQAGIDANSFLSYPEWFKFSGLATSVTALVGSPDAEGNMRILYRMTLDNS